MRTRDLIRAEAPDDIGVSVAYPLPGTVFHDRVRQQLGAQRNWRETDDLAMLFQGTYQSSFYRRVRDLLHAEIPQNGHQAALDAEWRALEREEHGARNRSRAVLQPSESAR